MENSIPKEKIYGEKLEFLQRLFSSFLFILIVVLLFLVPYKVFAVLCWMTYIIMVREIFSSTIKGKMLLRVFAAIVCFWGIRSFLYCRDVSGPSQCALLIFISSFTDIGAYSFGKILRGPKLCPRISPRKTWAGFWGGILSANVVFFCLNNIIFRLNNSNLVNLLIVETVIFAAVVGDLLESWFKRIMGVKDMGELFPGHGGILDRLDSLMMASITLAIIDILYFGL
ncbi:MAG: phosphatidate cytidylyltransferase [Holosporaceae bacterium]|jgi:phosphatidate cytidylyltransferase|nr:phosphatidate cytidylyltransferase [Holosporaceae bacterium]